MAYTGQDYFMKVKLANGATPSESKVRDFDINAQLAEKGSMLYAINNASGDLASLAALQIGQSGQVLTINNSGLPAWDDPSSVVSGAGNGALNLSVGNSTIELFTANQATNTASTLSFSSNQKYL